jgi:hypothetical protein
MWANMLSRYPAGMAMEGLTAMVEYPLPANRSKPQVSDLRAILDRLRWHRRADAPAIEESGKRGTAAPEWVWVWSWARFLREPRVEEPFPQQRDFVDHDETLSTSQYENLRTEWHEAGSPRLPNPLALAAVR